MKRVIARLTPRARKDMEERLAFVARFPGGKPEKRRHAIHEAFQQLRERAPERHAEPLTIG